MKPGMVALRVAAGGLLVWMGYLFLVGATIDFGHSDGADLAVRCSPLTYYLSFDYNGRDLDTTDGPRRTFTATRGEPQAFGSANLLDVHNTINTYCDRSRTSRAALIGLLAAPAAILSVLSVRHRRQPSA